VVGVRQASVELAPKTNTKCSEVYESDLGVGRTNRRMLQRQCAVQS
jgi:hypothetical protein